MRVDRWLYALPVRLRAVFHRGRVEQELDEELRDYIERATEAHLARGLSPDEARRAALAALGGLEARKEACRDARGTRLLDELRQDARYAGRTLAHARAFTAGAILTLALGLGASVAVFTIVNGVLLRPLPFPEPERLFVIWSRPLGPVLSERGMWDRDYLAFHAADRSFEHTAAFSSFDANLLSPAEPLHVRVASVTAGFFETLRVPPALGRLFVTSDEPQAASLIVLGYDVWQRAFGAEPDIVGRTVRLDGVPRTVVGVTPDGFGFPRGAQVWTPQVITYDEGRIMGVTVIGRLKRDVSREQAEAAVGSLVAHLPEKGDTWRSGVDPLVDVLVGDVRRPLQIFAAAVVLVLLIACANVANLLLARASGRQREIAVRAALGASRGRLIRQLLTESTLVALAGGALGVIVAHWAIPALLAMAPAGRIPRTELVQIDSRVLAFAFAVSLATGIVFGLVPAVRLTRRRHAESLAPGMRTFSREPERARAALVVAEIAVALVLLTGAGLLIQSFLRLRAIDTGVRPDNLLAMTVDLPASDYSSAERLRVFHQTLLGRLGTMPAVGDVSLVNWLPMGHASINGDYAIEGRAGEFYADKPAVSAGYFRQMGIHLLEGRDFTNADDGSRPGVAIVSRSVATLVDPSGHALGRRIVLGRPGPDDWLTIVGIVEDVRQYGPQQPRRAAVYQPYLQVSSQFFLSHITYLVRPSGDVRQVPAQMRAALRAVDATLAPIAIVAMREIVDATTADTRFYARLLGVFALIAVVLAMVGIYGVLAYSVAQRTPEIGVRMALGAERRTVLWIVLRRTLLLSAAGIAIGITLALVSMRVLATLLFAITPTDAPTMALVALALAACALAASWVPALRATRVDPIVALRHE
jgi:putative ABC transport system permease protein